MTPRALLDGLLRGEGEAFGRVLQNARTEGFASRTYGAEEARSLFRSAPATLAEAQAVTTPAGGVLFGLDGGDPVAMAADLHAGHVTRLWRLGRGRTAPAPPAATSAACDPDLDQRGGALAFEPRDHRHLTPAAASRIAALGAAWLRDPPEEIVGDLARPRFLVLRAWSQEDRVAALVRIESAAGSGRVGFNIAVLMTEEGVRTVVDVAGRIAAREAPWTAALR